MAANASIAGPLLRAILARQWLALLQKQPDYFDPEYAGSPVLQRADSIQRRALPVWGEAVYEFSSPAAHYAGDSPGHSYLCPLPPARADQPLFRAYPALHGLLHPLCRLAHDWFHPRCAERDRRSRAYRWLFTLASLAAGDFAHYRTRPGSGGALCLYYNLERIFVCGYSDRRRDQNHDGAGLVLH